MFNILQPFANALNESEGTHHETLPSIHTIQIAINDTSEEWEPIQDAGASPFGTLVNFLIFALFLGDEDLCSERVIKKILYAMRLLLEIFVGEDAAKDVLPAPDAVINFQNRMKNRIPVAKVTKHEVLNRKTKVRQEFC